MTIAQLYRKATPRWVRREVLFPMRDKMRRLTAPLRAVPDFIVIGGQKCGSTSLYSYLSQHPSITPSFTSEIFYFDLNYQEGRSFYRSRFPLVIRQRMSEWVENRPKITGEKSPNYIAHPPSAQRIQQFKPDVKIIAVLRNPVDRALSHYHHNLRGKYEEPTTTFEEALALEESRIEGELSRMAQDPDYQHYNYRHYAYLHRGIYADQLAVWLETFPGEQLYILQSEALFRHPQKTYNSVCQFLGIPNHSLPEFAVFNAGKKRDPLDPDMRQKLSAYFAPHNERLYQLIDQRFDW